VIALFATRMKLLVLAALTVVAAVTGGGFFDGLILLP
jgi:hypothetical protein